MAETRLDDQCTLEELLKDNKQNAELAKRHNTNVIWIDERYEIQL